jgi:hypothetical protein
MVREIIIVATTISCFLIIRAVIRAWGGRPPRNRRAKVSQ